MSFTYEHMQKTMVKNVAGTPPPGVDRDLTRHNRAPATAAVPAGAGSVSEALAALQAMPTSELRERAAQLAIEGCDTMQRTDLLEVLETLARDAMEE
jgi:hypothetical protein